MNGRLLYLIPNCLSPCNLCCVVMVCFPFACYLRHVARWKCLGWKVSGNEELCISLCHLSSLRGLWVVLQMWISDTTGIREWNGKCWRYRGQLKSLWVSLLETLLVLALPAWLSSGEFAQRCCLLAAERLLAASPLSWNREGQAVLWIHLMQIVAELVCLFLSSWMGRGNYQQPGNTHTQICVCLPGELGLQLVERNPLPLFSLWVSQLEFRVAVWRCDASKMQSWSFNSGELYGEDEPVGTLGLRAQVFYSLVLLSSLSSLPLEVMHTVKTH